MNEYIEWRTAVLAGLVAPDTLQNQALLDHWAVAESGANVMRWNNPLNTTTPYNGSTPANAVGVQRFNSWSDGATATVITLENGYYPLIVQGLRASAPPAWYEEHASGEFATWGTGAGFLANVPTIPTPEVPDMTAEQAAQLAAIAAALPHIEAVYKAVVGPIATFPSKIDRIEGTLGDAHYGLEAIAAAVAAAP